MGAYIVNPDLVQGRKQRSNEYRKSISEMDLDSLMFFERSKVMKSIMMGISIGTGL